MSSQVKGMLQTAGAVIAVLVVLKLVKGANVPVVSAAARSYT